jgi:hypothetical protein
MSAYAWFNVNLVRLQKAVLCANCEVISEGLNGHCSACGSEALLGLSRILGGLSEPAQAITTHDAMVGTATNSEYFSAAA